ncbi:insulinase family protein [bacterium]|nr:insulinase family protein [bacterium]
MNKDHNQGCQYKKSVLENGMRVVTEYIPYVRSVAVGFCIVGGSRVEPDPLNGATHFIEHMLFKGTKKRSSRDIAIEIDSIGGHLDAFTSREYTCFLANCLDENLNIAMDLLTDILLNPLFPPDETEMERSVILEEIRSIEDTPDEYVHDILTQMFWGDHPLGRPIIGVRSIIDSISSDALKGYYQRAYQPQRIILAAAGNLKHDQILDMVRDVIPMPDDVYKFPTQTIPAISPHLSLKEKELEQVHISLGTAALPHTDEARHAGYLLNTILGGGISSRLFQTIREERGLAYSICSFWNSYEDTGMLSVYAGTKKESAEEVVDLIIKEFQKLKADYVLEDELNKGKNQLKGNLMLSLESTTSRMSKLARQEMYFGRYFTLTETLDAIERVKAQDILELANRIMDTKYLNLSTIGPLNGTALGKRPLAC